MRWGPKAIAALLALACAGGAACGGGGGHDNVIITTRSSFPQGFLPVLAGTGRGDVALRVDSDLYFVDGQTSTVTVVSRADGRKSPFAINVGGASNVLLSITPGFGDDSRLFVGDNDGKIWTINADGSSLATPFVDTGAHPGITGQPITGLMFAPTGFGDFGGQLFAAAGTEGILKISGDPPHADPFTNPPGNYVDLAFSGTTLFAINDATDEIDTVNSSGAADSFQDGFDTPVGIAVDSTASEIYVADAGDDLLYTVPVAGGTPTARAAYNFDSTAPSGIAHDGLGAIAFITTDPPAIRGSNLPRIDPANANFGRIFSGPTVGYGDLEFDRSGAFVLTANDPDDPPASDSINNFLFSVSRDGSSANLVASGIRESDEPAEQLLSLAIDPETQAIYVGTDLGNLFRRMPDGTVTQLIDAPDGAPAMLGLELAPQTFCAPDPDPCLVATTEEGSVIEIDLGAPNLDNDIGSEPGARLSDLVFGSDGRLFVVDCDDTDPPGDSRVLELSPNGDVVETWTVDGRADGIEIDEGGNRLLVTTEMAGGHLLLEIDLASDDVTALANINIDDGYFPTGIVYDRLGTAVVRQGNNSTALDAVDVRP